MIEQLLSYSKPYIHYIYTYMYQNGNKTSKIMEAKACCVQSYSTMKQYKNFTQAFTSYI